MCLEIFFTSIKKAKSQLKGRKPESSRRQPSEFRDELCCRFSLAEMKAATNNFDHKLKVGESELGSVYKGFLNHGTSVVVIKRFGRLKSTSAGIEFQTCLQILCQLRHPNLVLLIGFCNERDERILVYEYMNRGALANHLQQPCADPLTWKQRLEICIGAANGLHYLHTGAKRAIYYRNVKSANILLNKDWTARIGDLGISKLGPASMSKLKNVMFSPLVLSCLKY